MAFVRKLLFWAFFFAFALLLLLAGTVGGAILSSPNNFTMRQLSFSGGSVRIPELELTWNLKDRKNPYFMLRAEQAALGHVRASRLSAVIKKGNDTLAARELALEGTRLEDVRAAFNWKWDRIEILRAEAQIEGQPVSGKGAVVPDKEGIWLELDLRGAAERRFRVNLTG